MISTSQLAAAGISRRAVDHRVETGVLRRIHRGVYRYGPVTGLRWREWAALLACGARACLSHASTLALCELVERPPRVEVTDPGGGRAHDGVVRHRSVLEPDELAVVHGLRTTTLARAFLDVARSMPSHELARHVEEAQVRRLVTRGELIAIVERHPHRAGAPALREVLSLEDEPALTRSEAERRLLELVRAARLPAPRTNVRIGRYEVDFLWHEQRLIVEVDGFAFHSSRAAFERDRARDAALQAMGYRVLRVTWRQLLNDAPAVIAMLAACLSSTGPLTVA